MPPQTFSAADHVTIQPSVLYFGTPVVLLTTLNEDESPNISPLSSAWALGDHVVLGLSPAGQGAANLQREGGCVLNFPSADLWSKVEKIARSTGRHPVPDYKARIGYEYVADKFGLGGFTAIHSETVRPPRIAECPIQFEARVNAMHGEETFAHLIVEARVIRIHAHRGIVVPGTHHIDTARWSPLFYVFRHYFGLGPDLGRNFRAES